MQFIFPIELNSSLEQTPSEVIITKLLNGRSAVATFQHE